MLTKTNTYSKKTESQFRQAYHKKSQPKGLAFAFTLSKRF